MVSSLEAYSNTTQYKQIQINDMQKSIRSSFEPTIPNGNRWSGKVAKTVLTTRYPGSPEPDIVVTDEDAVFYAFRLMTVHVNRNEFASAALGSNSYELTVA
jgi:hypothetical protein